MAEGTVSPWDEQERPRADQLVEDVKTRVTNARSELQSFDRQLRAFVKERPFVALLSAVAGGYLLARMVARR